MYASNCGTFLNVWCHRGLTQEPVQYYCGNFKVLFCGVFVFNCIILFGFYDTFQVNKETGTGYVIIMLLSYVICWDQRVLYVCGVYLNHWSQTIVQYHSGFAGFCRFLFQALQQLISVHVKCLPGRWSSGGEKTCRVFPKMFPFIVIDIKFGR